MSTFPALMPLPHLSTNDLFRSHLLQHPYHMPRTTVDSTLAKHAAHKRVALPSLTALSSRLLAPSRSEPKVVASPTGTLSVPPVHSPSTKRVRALANASKSITLEMLRPHFEKPLAEVANLFGICMTLMKKICRKNGVPRWPHRQIRGLRKSIWSIEKALRCCESEAHQRSYTEHLQKQRLKLLTILRGPVSPSSKAAFHHLLSEPYTSIREVTSPPKTNSTPTSPTRASSVPPVNPLPMMMHARRNVSHATESQGRVCKLPSIASLLTHKHEPRVPKYQF
ncbi:hypothetical protein PsorP6_006965 [Peronosclerospora sorghi]|uniref:Uncharacterized protein n=1 Tax=Peronosclerospora sorghi TaxID=230839 RepID=A0ACC0WBC7_9STRA|nr:hypothetical protein PsorP6_006965 [Peronosclerospora sorghi]